MPPFELKRVSIIPMIVRGKAKGRAKNTRAKSKARFTKRCLIRCFIEKISSPIYFLA